MSLENKNTSAMSCAGFPLGSVLLAGWLLGRVQEPQESREPVPPAELVADLCGSCHGERRKGNVDLLAVLAARDPADGVLLRKAARRVAEGVMPPRREHGPDAEERAALAAWLRGEAVARELGAGPPPGASPLRRLTHDEYRRTVRALLGAEVDVTAFPGEGSGGEGFRNFAGTQRIPPVQFEAYLESAERSVEAFRARDAVGPRDGGDAASARRVLADFAGRAFRRPGDEEQVAPFLAYLDRRLSAGVDPSTALDECLVAVLASPSFLFRSEARGAAGEVVDDLELAVRLSYFLWSEPPDETLLTRAEEGTLTASLDAEVARLLEDPRSRALAENFTVEWLELDRLRTAADPDRSRFREFDARLRESMIAEVVLLFDGLLREERPLWDLLAADYTWVDSRLAKLYGLDASLLGDDGDRMQRVALPDAIRGGVLTTAAVLTLTSAPRRTSPVLRGKWILDALLGDPPAAPPPNVAPLPADEEKAGDQTLRQALEQHRSQAACAGCHARMDGLGFALEHYDPIGRWRDQIGDLPVDDRGTTAAAESIDGVLGVRALLGSRRPQFVETLTGRLLGYALGRELLPADRPVIDAITSEILAGEGSLRQLVAAIIRTPQFRARGRAPEDG